MIKVIVFDFDGVLVDSNSLKRGTFYDLFFGVDDVTKKMIDDIWLEIDGQNHTRFEFIRTVFLKLGKSGNELESLVKQYAEKYDEIVQRSIKSTGLITGVSEVLDILNLKYNLYINSATPDFNLQKTIDALEIRIFFKGVYGKELMGTIFDQNSKKTILKKIMESEKVSGDEVLFVGDGEADKEAAFKFGCHFIGITNNFNGWSSRSNFKTLLSVVDLDKAIAEI